MDVTFQAVSYASSIYKRSQLVGAEGRVAGDGPCAGVILGFSRPRAKLPMRWSLKSWARKDVRLADRRLACLLHTFVRFRCSMNN